MHIRLEEAQNGIHKYVAVFPDGHKVRFGRRGYSDYTKHKDRDRMQHYLTRHQTRENWKISGARTPGFWSRWILWSEPSLSAAIRRTEKILKMKIVRY
jgi:hypothetical protein